MDEEKIIKEAEIINEYLLGDNMQKIVTREMGKGVTADKVRYTMIYGKLYIPIYQVGNYWHINLN